MSTFNLPDLGEGLQEAEVVAWHVAEGDHVVIDQPLVSVETEKAVVEIPSPAAGHIAELLARPGERVKVGAPLLTFEEGAHPEAGTVVGELAKPEPPTGGTPAAPTAAPALATPAVRAHAKQLGVDLSQVKGTGPGGAITRSDVEGAAQAATPADALRGARRTMALNMARAWREVAHATLQDRADIEAWFSPQGITVRLIRGIVAGCGAVPALNASFDSGSIALRQNPKINLGLAIDSAEGLFVPVLHDVGSSSPDELRNLIDGVKAGVAGRSLSPGQFRDATITLSNFGTLAGQHAALIIMPPQVAILGAGRIADQPVRSGDGLSMHRMLPLSLTFDHRAVTGGEAARFLRAVIGDLEMPA